MARGTQLQELVSMLRAEAGHSTLVSAGVDALPMLHQKIRRTQALLADEFEWPFLRVQPFLQMNAGQRYYDMPAGLNFDRIEMVICWRDNQPIRLTRGIDALQYAAHNSDAGERSSPVTHWQEKYVDELNSEQIEVWPIADDNTQKLQFFGFRNLKPLIADSDKADLDDQLIVLTAAAEILASQENESAPIVRAAAGSRFSRLKDNASTDGRQITMGGVGYPRDYRGPIIRVRG